MIRAVIGTNKSTRLNAFKTFLEGAIPTHYIRSDNAYELPSLTEAKDLFGEKIIVMLEQVASSADNRVLLENLFDNLRSSENIFIFDEPFIDTIFAKKIEKHADIFIDAREGKEKEKGAFSLVEAIEKRDKKNAWIEWMKVRELQPEAIHGLMWWKIKTMWEDKNTGRRVLPYTEEELVKMAFSLVKMSHEAHRGKENLSEELEKFILSI